MSATDVEEELLERRRESLFFAFGPTVMSALADPTVIEVVLNDDGKLWVHSLGGKKHVSYMDANDAFAILNQVSSELNGELSRQNPIVEGELLLLNGERFTGVAPPVVANPIFAIRKPASKIFKLDDYVRSGVLTFRQAELLRQAISERLNILVVGGTGSGKTTFCNALLDAIADLTPDRRMLIIQDTLELQCALEDRAFLRSSQWTSAAQLAKVVNRLSPDSITVGEVRDGPPTLVMLKLWNTGHPGGLATVHADSAYEGLTRVDQLIQEVSNFPQRVLIGKAVNVAVFLEKRGSQRAVKEIIRVRGYDESSNRFQVENIQ